MILISSPRLFVAWHRDMPRSLMPGSLWQYESMTVRTVMWVEITVPQKGWRLNVPNKGFRIVAWARRKMCSTLQWLDSGWTDARVAPKGSWRARTLRVWDYIVWGDR